MLDVLHYLLDSDMTSPSSTHAKTRDAIRSAMFSGMYGQKYNYAVSDNSDSSGGFDYDDEDFFRMPNVSNETKPYMPPTPFDPDAANPFGGALREMPLG